jgi:hypothetical protein
MRYVKMGLKSLAGCGKLNDVSQLLDKNIEFHQWLHPFELEKLDI